MKMTKLSCLLVAILASAYVADAYKILVVFPFPGKSHTILGEGVVKLLLDAGHDVTYVTPILNKKNENPKLRQIDVSDNIRAFPQEAISLNSYMKKETDTELKVIFNFTSVVFQMTLENPNVQKLCKDTNEKFDVIIAEWMFIDLYAVYGAIFKAPFIWFATVDPHWMVLRLIDQMPNPSYTADITSSSLPPFSLYDRVKQLFFQLAGMAMIKMHVSSMEDEMYKEIQHLIEHRGHEVPTLEDLRYNPSLMLGNSHVSLGSAIPLPQSYKPVGGYHIDPNVKKLPEDLQKLMDNAKHGVIYFSMGSNLKSQSLPQEVKKNLLQMFSKLKQTVIWKFEETMPDTPPNVKIMQWAPQHSILVHPNCKLFITHGGLLSTTETVHFGKPIIGIPVFGDQFLNVQRAVKRGFARKVDLSFKMADDLKVAIDEVLNNPSYASRAKELSLIYHHRPATPGAELVHWVEHVALTKGAAHLRSPALDVPFYQKFFLDVLAILLGVLATLYIVIKRILSKNKTQKQTRQKKNN